LHLGDLDPADTLEPGQKTITTTWTIAIDRATTRTPQARAAAELAAYTDPNGAPQQLWTTPTALTHQGLNPNHPDSATTARHALAALRDYHLITITPNPNNPQAIRTHHLAQQATRTTLTNPQQTLEVLADALTQTWPIADTRNNWGATLRNNTTALLDNWPELGTNPHHNAVVYRAIRSHGEAGDPAGAAHALQELLTDQIRILGPDHPDTLTTRNNLAEYRAQAGDPESALATFRELVGDQIRVLGPDHPDTLTTQRAITHWQRRAGGQDQRRRRPKMR